MSTSPSTPPIRLTEQPMQATAVVHERVPLQELPAFFERAFHAAFQAVEAQGLHPTGPPFALYRGMPGATADVEAGFPVNAPFEGRDVGGRRVEASTLPGGRVVETVHVGPFDTLEATYERVEGWMSDHDLVPAEHMWECYLSDPEQTPDPATWRTQVCWPVAG